MSIVKGNNWFGKLAIAGIAALGLAAVAVPLHPATAQLYFGIGPDGFSAGVGAPYYAPYAAPYAVPYYAPYAAPYYAPYYGPSYYYGQ